VLDASLRLPRGARLLSTLDEGPVVIFAGPRAAGSRARRLTARGATVERLPARDGRLDLRELLRRLAGRDVTRLLVEGGGEVHGSFLEEGLADRLVLYLAPRIIGGRDARPLVGGTGPMRLADAVTLSRPISYRVGSDLVVEGDLSG
jgi:diaminohydroxyphosphoribosylaminopyrimidine deaminase / 5-amino-6-(5-phosphoribosylamino)uracil reductase